jgi:abhydrolase domain-containing protein 6
MKKKWIVGIIMAAIVLSFLEFSTGLGKYLYLGARSAEAAVANVKEHNKVIAGVNWHYYARNELGAKSCIVLVHGFTAEAANWFRFAKHLDADACVIAPDLIGFGDSDYQEKLSYSISAQTARLEEFLKTIAPQAKYHLIGSSMGGHIVSYYSVHYPADVQSLTVFDGGGVTPPKPSLLIRELKETGKSLFDIKSYDDFSALVKVAMVDAPWMPGAVKRYLANQFIERNARYSAIFKEIYLKDLLDEDLKKISKPMLIVWGDHDNLLDVSMADVFEKGVSGAKKIILPNIGHLPFLEVPSESAQIYNEFYATVK